MTDTRVVVLVGSLRADSLNRRIAEHLRAEAPAGVVVEIAENLAELPFYNEDLDNGTDVPAAAVALREQVAAADRVLAVTPEYNGTMPAVLNNAIDWLSRPYGVGAIKGKPFGVVGATPTPYGGKWAHAGHRAAPPASPVRSWSRTSPSRSPRSRATSWPTPRSSPGWPPPCRRSSTTTRPPRPEHAGPAARRPASVGP